MSNLSVYEPAALHRLAAKQMSQSWTLAGQGSVTDREFAITGEQL